MKGLNFLLLIVAFCSNRLYGQYTVNGSATAISCNCYTLTTEKKYDSASVWNVNRIDLGKSFDFHFNVYLGCIDSTGADGIAFVLQPLTTNLLGADGEGLGFGRISPSVGVTLDTWQNVYRNDPPYDHISVQLNGDVTHGNDLAGPVQASATSANIEDCNWHVLRITWDASAKILSAYFDGQFRLQSHYDLVANVFHNDPMVYWGFTGSTGGGYNLQQFCTVLDPLFKINVDSSTCIGNPLVFTDRSDSFSAVKNYYWDFGDGSTSIQQNPPPHNYSTPGVYQIMHVITGVDGCTSDTARKTIDIGAKPIADFNLYDTCTNKFLGVTDRSRSVFGSINQWTWRLDGALNSTDSLPPIHDLSLGPHQLSLSETTVYGCESDTVTKIFSVHSTPVVNIGANNGCRNEPINFYGQQIDNTTNITKWNWNFGDSLISQKKNPEHVYPLGGTKTVHLTAVADDGCTSNDTTKQIYVESIFADAGKDTSVQQNIPFILRGSCGGDFEGLPVATWSPSTGLNSNNGLSPTAILQNDQVYHLKVTTGNGCVATDSVTIKVFKTAGVLVPNAFTPNNDGLNDVLRPRYNGIKHLDYFAIYDRWGQLVFKTSDMNGGWDGKLNGQPQSAQTFVWIISAEDFNGKRFQLKGTTTIIR
jgi:gliding motility-associated-like protein